MKVLMKLLESSLHGRKVILTELKPVTDWTAAITDMNSSLATYGLNDFYFIMGDSGHPVLKFNSY